MIGSLMYLTSSRSDISFSVGLCSRFQSCPEESHLAAVKRIFRYLLGTQTLSLWYPRIDMFDFVGICDADYAGDKIDRKSTSDYCTFLGHSLVLGTNKKQSTVALSNAEAEYMATSSCCSQLLWMKHQMVDYNLQYDHIPLLHDNMSAINLTKNPIQHSRTKHIEIRHHFIREHVQKGNIEVCFANSKNQLADILTKPLSEERFCFLRKEIGMLSSTSVE